MIVCLLDSKEMKQSSSPTVDVDEVKKAGKHRLMLNYVDIILSLIILHIYVKELNPDYDSIGSQLSEIP